MATPSAPNPIPAPAPSPTPTPTSTPTPAPTLRLRPYHPTDLPAVSTICALGNATDDLSLYMTRSIDKYWLSYRAGNTRILKYMLAGEGVYGVICEEVPSGEMVGWGIFTRHGESSVARGWRRRSAGAGWAMAIERRMQWLEKIYYREVPGVDPSLDRLHERAIRPILHEDWAESVFSDYWELDGLYVHPDHWRRGIGRRLIHWVVERAGQEGVPVVVNASPMGKPAYESCGFKVLKRAEPFDRFIDAYCGGGETKGLWKLVWDPPGGDWLGRAKAEEERKKVEKAAREERKTKGKGLIL